jgi:hypothetical protein
MTQTTAQKLHREAAQQIADRYQAARATQDTDRTARELAAYERFTARLGYDPLI